MPPIPQTIETLRSRAFGLRALIADFDSTSLELLSSYLKEIGMEVIIAKDGLTALELFRNQKPQIVFLEAMLPKMSGFELSQQINIESQGKVPVIIITGIYKDTRHKIEAIQTYKAAAFLTKPWQRDEMAKIIVDVLGPAVKPPADEEESLLESLEDLTPIIKEKPSISIPKPSPPSPPQSKETKVKEKASGGDEIDKLLEKTLADLGFNGKKRVIPEPRKEERLKIFPEQPAKTIFPSSESKPKPPELKPSEPLKPEPAMKEAKVTVKPAIETEIKKTPISLITERENIIDTEKQPFATSPVLSPKVAEELKTKPYEQPIKSSAIEEREMETGLSPARPPLYPTYFETEHEEKKRPSSFILFGVAGAVVLTLLGVFFFRPKKAETPFHPQPAMEAERVVAEAPQNFPSRLEEQETLAKPMRGKEVARKQESTLASILPLNKEEPPVEEAPPILAAESRPAPLALPTTPPSTKVETEAPPAQVATADEQDKKPASQAEPPSPPLKEGDLVPLEQVDIQPRPIKIVEPKYPELAKQMGLEGAVVVNALISENGDVIRTEILRGIKNGAALEQAAQAAVRQWKFTPAVKNGLKVKVWKPIETRFRLKQ